MARFLIESSKALLLSDVISSIKHRFSNNPAKAGFVRTALEL